MLISQCKQMNRYCTSYFINEQEMGEVSHFRIKALRMNMLLDCKRFGSFDSFTKEINKYCNLESQFQVVDRPIS